MDNQVHRVVLDLFDIGAVKFGEFRLKLHETKPDAPLSPIYIDLRTVRSYPPTFRDIAGILGRMVLKHQPDFVADVPTAVSPIVGVISCSFNLPMLSPRIDAKSHGAKGKLEGVAKSGASVVLVDDLITQAHSKIEAVNLLRQHELNVEHVVVLIDREQGGGDELARHGCSLHAAVTLRSMLDSYLKERRITDVQRSTVLEYLSSSGVQ
jgi:uridine monophosphate synthetase